MATLYISEYVRMGLDSRVPVPAGEEPALATQTVAVSGTSAQSSAFNANTRFVRIHTDTICCLVFGSSPTATTSGMRMAADQTEYFAVTPGNKLAVILGT